MQCRKIIGVKGDFNKVWKGGVNTMDKIKTNDSVMFQKRIETGTNKGVQMSIDFYNVPGERRNRIEELVDQFLDSVTEILAEGKTNWQQFDNTALVMPDEQSKTMIISSGIPDTVLRVNAKEAEALVTIIQDQIQQWK